MKTATSNLGICYILFRSALFVKCFPNSTVRFLISSLSRGTLCRFRWFLPGKYAMIRPKKGGIFMKKRIKLCDRQLPQYSNGEEVMNMVTHIVGGSFGILVLILSLLRATTVRSAIGAGIYGTSMIAIYTMSSVYHGMKKCTGKKVLQVLDHCTIYLLIAGSYTVIALGALYEYSPALGKAVVLAQWTLAAIAITVTAIDLKKYNAFSMVCYIGMGWMVLLFLPQTMAALSPAGFYWLLAGGIAYTIGAVLYGIGSKMKWMHSVFHIFVVLGSALQFVSIYFFAII